MENFRIESLEINKIGAFEHLKMDFPKKTDPEKAEIHILTGENGTGKSTILMLLASCADNSNDENIRKRWHSPSNIEGYKIRINRVGKIYSYDYLKIPSDENYRFNENGAGAGAFCLFAYSGNRFTQSELISESEYTMLSPIKNAVNFSRSTNSKEFIKWILSNKTKSLIAFSNNDYVRKEKYDETVNRVEDAISGIIGSNIQFVLQDRPIVSVAIKLDGIVIDMDVLPDGIKSIISWLGDLMMRIEMIKWLSPQNPLDQNIILFLDEIEVHLHPAWQRKILPVVQKLFKNAQIFISTHSPFVVGSVDGAWVHKLKKVGAYAVLDGEPVLSEDGKSVRRILDEVFGINEQYGINVEDDLKRFRVFRQKIMMGQEYDIKEFDELVKHLASQSTELEQMMGMEMNQLRRITQKELI